MRRMLTRVRAALVMGVIWAVAWAPIGVLAGLIIDPDGSMDEMWFLIGAYPGFLGGVVFSLVLWRAHGKRRLDQISTTRAAVWGAAAGLCVGVLPFLIGSATSAAPLWLLAGSFITATIVLSAGAAAGSLMLAKRATLQVASGSTAQLPSAQSTES